MKWATTLDDLNKNPVLGINKGRFNLGRKPRAGNPIVLTLKKPDTNISKCFVVYPTIKELQLALEKDYEVWFTARIPKQFISKMKRQPSQEHYELFCGGWVQYHDDQILGNKFEHTVYFDWKIKRGYVRAHLKTQDLTSKNTPTLVTGQPYNSQRDAGYIFPPGKITDPPKPPAPPPPYA